MVHSGLPLLLHKQRRLSKRLSGCAHFALKPRARSSMNVRRVRLARGRVVSTGRRIHMVRQSKPITITLVVTIDFRWRTPMPILTPATLLRAVALHSVQKRQAHPLRVALGLPDRLAIFTLPTAPGYVRRSARGVRVVVQVFTHVRFIEVCCGH